MLTGSEPISAGNLGAALGGFTHHRAGAQFAHDGRIDDDLVSETVKGTVHAGPCYIEVPFPATSAAAVGGTLTNGTFVPDRAGVFEVSVSVKSLTFVGYAPSDSKFFVAISSGGTVVAETALSSATAANVALSATVVVPKSGMTVEGRVFYKYGNDAYSSLTNAIGLKISIVEV